MDRNQFVSAEPETWWLLDRDLDSGIEEVRTDLGAALGWTDREWYAEWEKREALYNFIESSDHHLLDELDGVTDNEMRRRWLGSVVALAHRGQAPDAPTADESPHADTVPSSGRSVDSAEPLTTNSQAEAASAGPDTATPGQWDENWQMLFRVGPNGEYQFSFSDDRQTVNPGAQWLSQEEAIAARAGATTSGQTVDIPSTEEQVQQQLDVAIQTVMSDLATEGLSDLANQLGVSAEELEAVVQNPDFQRMVAEEAAKLASGGTT